MWARRPRAWARMINPTADIAPPGNLWVGQNHRVARIESTWAEILDH